MLLCLYFPDIVSKFGVFPILPSKNILNVSLLIDIFAYTLEIFFHSYFYITQGIIKISPSKMHHFFVIQSLLHFEAYNIILKHTCTYHWLFSHKPSHHFISLHQWRMSSSSNTCVLFSYFNTFSTPCLFITFVCIIIELLYLWMSNLLLVVLLLFSPTLPRKIILKLKFALKLLFFACCIYLAHQSYVKYRPFLSQINFL